MRIPVLRVRVKLALFHPFLKLLPDLASIDVLLMVFHFRMSSFLLLIFSLRTSSLEASLRLHNYPAITVSPLSVSAGQLLAKPTTPKGYVLSVLKLEDSKISGLKSTLQEACDHLP
jgi:hypothetical protein